VLNGFGGKMSVNHNRSKFNKALTSMEYTRLMKNETISCQICARKGGGYKSSCHPSDNNPKGWRWRKTRTCKHNRKTQWK